MRSPQNQRRFSLRALPHQQPPQQPARHNKTFPALPSNKQQHRAIPQLRKLIISMRTRRKLQTMLQKPTLPGIQSLPQQRLSNFNGLKTKRSLSSKLPQRGSIKTRSFLTQQLLVGASSGGCQYSQPPFPDYQLTSSCAHQGSRPKLST